MADADWFGQVQLRMEGDLTTMVIEAMSWDELLVGLDCRPEPAPVDFTVPRRQLDFGPLRRLSQAFGRGSTGVVLADPETRRYLAVSEAYRRMLGYSEEQLLRMTVDEVTHPDDRGTDIAQSAELRAGKVGAFTVEKRLVRADASDVWVSVTVSMVHDEDGRATAMLGHVIDISDLKTASAEAEFKSLVLDALAAAVFATDLDGRVVLWNPEAERLYQFTAEETVGRMITELIVPDGYLGAALEGMAEAAVTGVWTGDGTLRRRDGSKFCAHIRARMTFDRNGVPLGFTTMTHDMSHTVTELREEAAAKDEFLAAVSHELRTPLTAVVGFAEVLAETEACDDGGAAMVGEILRGARDIAHIVDDLLVVARGELNRLEVVAEAVGLGGQAAEVLDSLGEDVTVAGGDVVVVADPARVRQIIRNLVVNAHRYGGDQITITVGGDESHGTLVVADDGAGISSESEPLIFQPYWRERRSSEGTTPGLGIGLAISRMLAEAMGGALDYARVDGETLFTLTLPAA